MHTFAISEGMDAYEESVLERIIYHMDSIYLEFRRKEIEEKINRG